MQATNFLGVQPPCLKDAAPQPDPSKWVLMSTEIWTLVNIFRIRVVWSYGTQEDCCQVHKEGKAQKRTSWCDIDHLQQAKERAHEKTRTTVHYVQHPGRTRTQRQRRKCCSTRRWQSQRAIPFRRKDIHIYSWRCTWTAMKYPDFKGFGNIPRQKVRRLQGKSMGKRPASETSVAGHPASVSATNNRQVKCKVESQRGSNCKVEQIDLQCKVDNPTTMVTNPMEYHLPTER